MGSIVEKIQTCLRAIDEIQMYELKIALLCTLFDHICETEHLDKKKTLDIGL